jgi:hypothetical protein
LNMVPLKPSLIPYGPLPLAPGTRPKEGMQFSDDLEDRKISYLNTKLNALPPVRDLLTGENDRLLIDNTSAY